jgi:universal stress protein E
MTDQELVLVVVDPTAKSQPAIERAAWIAKSLGARLELFVCDYNPHLSENNAFDRASLAKARASLLENHKRRLLDLARPLVAAGLEVAVDARWDHPLYDGIVRKSVDSGAALVVKDTHYHPVLKRSIFSNTDWNLIRNCAAPLWLVKPRAAAVTPCVLAAVDPLHERDKPADLDKAILAVAQRVCAATAGELHVFHGFDIAPALAVSTNSLTMPISLPVRELTESMQNEHTAAVHALTDAHDVPRDHVHIHQGGTRELLVAITDQLHVDVVVMGAVSRSGLKRLFLGNTAEEVLDKLSCDVLIVKPPGFAPTLAD